VREECELVLRVTTPPTETRVGSVGFNTATASDVSAWLAAAPVETVNEVLWSLVVQEKLNGGHALTMRERDAARAQLSAVTERAEKAERKCAEFLAVCHKCSNTIMEPPAQKTRDPLMAAILKPAEPEADAQLIEYVPDSPWRTANETPEQEGYFLALELPRRVPEVLHWDGMKWTDDDDSIVRISHWTTTPSLPKVTP
jgi:hypothetical protein